MTTYIEGALPTQLKAGRVMGVDGSWVWMGHGCGWGMGVDGG